MKKNLTTHFILPLLDRAVISYGESLMGTYLQDTLHELKGDYLFVLLKVMEKSCYTKSLEFLVNHECYVGDYDVLPLEYKMVVMDFSDYKYKKDYKLVIEGKFSEISQGAKDLICRFLTGNSSIPDVLYKGERLRKYWEEQLGLKFSNEWELWDKPDINKETFTLDKLQGELNFKQICLMHRKEDF